MNTAGWAETCSFLHSSPDSPPFFLYLLGGPDLREECIKLKKRVFDLERQNQMLSALLQQKLQLTANPLPQVGKMLLLSPWSQRLWPCWHQHSILLTS